MLGLSNIPAPDQGAANMSPDCTLVADNIVTNCGFETGAFTPEWILSGELSYWLEQNFFAYFVVLWNGVQIDRPFPFDYQPYTQHVVAGLIGTGADTLTFCAVNDDNFFGLDDIVVICNDKPAFELSGGNHA